MRSFLYILFSLLFAVGPGVMAEAKSISQTELDRLATQFYVDQFKTGRPMHAPQDCVQTPNGPKCVDVACDLLGRYGCDELSQVEGVGRACRGNYDGTCLKSSCGFLGRFGCDELIEVTRVATSCQGVYSMDCINTACGLLGRFGCDELIEVERVGKSCRGSDAQCIQSVCARLGRYGCDELVEVERVAASCAGR